MSEQEDVRSEVKQWLADNWDPELALLDWRRKLVDSGWATPTWPAEWFGRGLPGWADPIVHEEFAVAGAGSRSACSVNSAEIRCHCR